MTQHSRHPNHTTPPSLLLRIRDHHDDGAWDVFCDVYSPLLYDYCRKRGLQASDAADVVQETLLRIAKGIVKFEYDQSKGRFRDWLYTILHNEIRRMLGRKKPTQELKSIDNDAVGKGGTWDEHFYEHILKSALERIQPRFETDTWEAFTNVWLKNQAADEVAKLMERSIDFVYLSKSRVLKRLRLEIEELADDAGLKHG